MDYTERGTVEKTLDGLIEDADSFGTTIDDEFGPLAADGALTPDGRAYVTGVLSGVLATVRAFSDEDTAFDSEDVEEVLRITDGREKELIEAFAGDDVDAEDVDE